MLKKRSFFEKLTGSIRLSDDDEKEVEQPVNNSKNKNKEQNKNSNDPNWFEEKEEEEGELTVDAYETPGEIIIQTMIAGVEPENLNITIMRDVVTIKGKREETRGIDDENYFTKELYWGSFSRTINLPKEIEPEEAEAIEKHGLLIIKLPIINKDKKTMLKVKSL